jgi:tRNA threonylcarbamoyl adenosine modification protein (Sua5/YciO/YrdC/YwlC family)
MPTPILEIDPERPNPRILDKAVTALQGGGIIAYPTDSYYGLGCDLFSKRSIEKLYLLKKRDPKKPVSFVCHDLATVSQYAQISDLAFRALRKLTPGPYTFILPATHLVPHLVITRQRTVGVRIPDNKVALGLAERLGRPIATTSASTPEGEPLVDPKDIRESIGHALELILGGGYQLREPSTVLSFVDDEPRILRSGKGHNAAEALFQLA